jgi:segregation and condensation protein A
MDTSKDYQINLDVFQGPLDLLLFLIRKKKIDIHDIPIATITREYLHYLEKKERLNLEREAEFLLMASLLIYIKSQMLLPREKALDDEEDPRRILVNRLLDYQKIKAACALLREKEKKEIPKWQRDILPPYAMDDNTELTEVSLFSLAEVFFLLMKRREQEDIKIIKGKDYSLEAKMKEIVAILEENAFLDFLDYFQRQETIGEALVAFFCLLELIKAEIVIAVQDTLFQTIKVWLREEQKT